MKRVSFFVTGIILTALISASCDRDSSSEPDGKIHLKYSSFDPLAESAQVTVDQLSSAETRPGAKPFLVQFSGPVSVADKEALNALDIDPLVYIPDNTFIILLDEERLDRVRQLDNVRWAGEYAPEFKVSPGLAPDNLPADLNPLLITVQVFDKSSVQKVKDDVEGLGLTVTLAEPGFSRGYIRAEVPRDATLENALEVARLPEVEWIERYIPNELHNDASRWVIQSGVPSWTPLWDNGLDGSGQIAGFADTGVDVDMCYYWDAAEGLPGPTVNMNQRKIISYHDRAGNGDWDGHDHGTHVSGTIAGDNLATLGAPDTYDGIAYNAKLVAQDVGCGGGSLCGIPGDLNFLFQEAYDDGARIHSDSWGHWAGGLTISRLPRPTSSCGTTPTS
jgi:subtilisin family serine protease